jgi:hypothetical protein
MPLKFRRSAKSQRGLIKATSFLGYFALCFLLVSCGGSGDNGSGEETPSSAASTIASITLAPAVPSIQVGQTLQFVATAMDASGNAIPTMTFTWASSNSAVANVSNTGLATGLAGGGATLITASAAGVTSPAVQLQVTEATTGGRVYATNFALDENPISEKGNWINGQHVGQAWSDVKTTAGHAIGTQSGAGQRGYDDSTALLTGPWGADQTVTATVHSVNQVSGGIFEEVEIRLRSSLSINHNSGYEILFRAFKGADSYTQIVRWNGPLNDFTYLDSRSGEQWGVTEGDVVKASIIGNVITVYINDVQVLQTTDDTYSSGSPGMGFFLSGPSGLNSDYGFTRFSASD